MIHKPSRLAAWSVALLLLVLALVPSAALAQTKDDVERTEAAKQEALARLKDVNGRLEAALTEYQRIFGELESLRWKNTQVRARVKSYEEDATILRERATESIIQEYKGGGIDLIEVALEADSIQEIMTSRLLFERAAAQDFVSISRLDVVNRELDRLGDQLAVDLDTVADLEAQADAAVEVLDAVQQEAAAEFAKAQDVAADALAEFKEAERRRRERESGGGGDLPPGVGGKWQCPVPNATFINDWHFPRSGGRVHLGTDMMAPRGSKNYAVDDGRVRLFYNSLGGTSIWLTADHGAGYYYAHLDGYASGLHSGDRVTKGQVIAYTGNTGNAAGGATHTHFEIHPGNGAAVNPYPTLVRYC